MVYSSRWTGCNAKSFRCNASTVGCQEHCWGKYGGPGTCIFEMGTLTGVEYKDLSIKNIYMNKLLTLGKAELKCRHFPFSSIQLAFIICWPKFPFLDLSLKLNKI